MAKAKKVLESLDAIEQANDTRFIEVDTDAGTFRLRSLTGQEYIQHLESADARQTVAERRRALLELVARSMVNSKGEDLAKTDESRARAVALLLSRDFDEISKVVSGMLKINNLVVVKKADEKNDSSRGPSDASATASPSQPGA